MILSVEYNLSITGQTMADTKKFIGDAVTCGVLRRHATSSLNLVNASLYAKELGVEVMNVSQIP